MADGSIQVDLTACPPGTSGVTLNQVARVGGINQPVLAFVYGGSAHARGAHTFDFEIGDVVVQLVATNEPPMLPAEGRVRWGSERGGLVRWHLFSYVAFRNFE